MLPTLEQSLENLLRIARSRGDAKLEAELSEWIRDHLTRTSAVVELDRPVALMPIREQIATRRRIFAGFAEGMVGGNHDAYLETSDDGRKLVMRAYLLRPQPEISYLSSQKSIEAKPEESDRDLLPPLASLPSPDAWVG